MEVGRLKNKHTEVTQVMHEKHDLHHEFPEHFDRIHELKVSNAHFARLFDEYHKICRAIVRIEEGVAKKNRYGSVCKDQIRI